MVAKLERENAICQNFLRLLINFNDTMRGSASLF